MTPVRLIIVGLGARARTWLQVAGANADIEIVALCDPDPAARTRAAEQFPDIPIGADIADVIGTEADAVLLCTPPGGREHQIEESCAQGLAILAEKPLADEVVTAARYGRNGRGRQCASDCTFGYGREVFAFSLALQNLFWGLSQPLAGAFADKFGTSRVIIVGTIFYSLGLYITATADSFVSLHIGAGILIGMGIAGTGLGVILPAMARMVRPEKRALALGVGTAAGSAGQFLFIPVAREFLVAYGWQTALIIMAVGALSMILFSPVFKGDEKKNVHIDNEPSQTLREAVNEASSHIHYWLLIAGFFVCGFQLAFITVHMPSYLADKGFDSSVAASKLSNYWPE